MPSDPSERKKIAVQQKRGVVEEEVSRRRRGWPNDSTEQGADDGADERVARSPILHLFATLNISGALEERIHSHGSARSHITSVLVVFGHVQKLY